MLRIVLVDTEAGKGSLHADDLRLTEVAKIKCGRAHFAALVLVTTHSDIVLVPCTVHPAACPESTLSTSRVRLAESPSNLFKRRTEFRSTHTGLGNPLDREGRGPWC